MNTFRRAVAIFVLIILGSVLGAEAMAFSDSHELFRAASGTQITSTEHGHSHDADSATSKCSDPCHTGQSHFGHSLYNTAHAHVFFSDSSIELTQLFKSKFALQGPTLEGPRRPPRLS